MRKNHVAVSDGITVIRINANQLRRFGRRTTRTYEQDVDKALNFIRKDQRRAA